MLTTGKFKKGLLGSGAFVIILGGMAPALAQEEARVADESAPEQSQAASRTGIETIIVTANKREESQQRTATSLTALPSQTLETRAIIDPSQLAGIAPGIQFQSSFLLLTYIRGIGNYSSQPGVDQSIAYNVDGNYVSRAYGMPNILFDLERIELLRGPQGTLQGRNSIGGSVNIVTAKPVFDFEAKAAVTAGNYGLITTEAMVNLPVAENVALRLSAASSDHKGYMDNGFGDADTQGARVRLLAEPTPELEILLTAEYSRRDEKGPSYSLCPPGNDAPACVGIDWDPFAGTPGQGENDVDNIDEENYLRAKNFTIYGDVNYDLGFATLTWAPSYRNHEYLNHTEFSHFFGYAPAAKDELHQQELRLASNSGSAVEWVVGLYYGRQEARERNYFTTATGPVIAVDDPVFGAIGHVYFKNDIDDYVYSSKSVFAQVTIPVFDNFRITAGGRYTDDKKSITGTSGLVVDGPTLLTGPASSNQQLDKFTYKAGVEFDAADEVMLYANVSTGFKSGGVNGVPEDSVLRATFAPEEIRAYQAGIKSRFLDGNVQVNAEGFYYNLEGYQTSVLLLDTNGLLVGGTLNAQKARLFGGEVEASALATPLDRVDIALSYLDAEHEEFFIPETGLDLSDSSISNAPEFTFTGNYAHTFELASGGYVVAHFETRYESSQWTDYRLAPGTKQESFWRHSADLTYTSPDERWTLGAFVRNIGNNGALTHGLAGLGIHTLGLPYAPRTYGVRASASF